MNVKKILALSALSLAAGAALADESALTRAQVADGVIEARAAGTLVPAGERSPAQLRNGDDVDSHARASQGGSEPGIRGQATRDPRVRGRRQQRDRARLCAPGLGAFGHHPRRAQGNDPGGARTR